MRLKEKISIVTGGSSGIGRATSLRFAKEGSKVVVSDVNEEEGIQTVNLIKENGGEASFIPANVSKVEDVQRLIDETVTIYGSIDVLFNNAGIGNSELKLTELSVEEWENVIDVNLKGVFLGMKYAIPVMEANKGGSIINTSSVLGLKGKKYVAPYNASKGGVITLTKNAALEFGQKGIRVNAIGPGVIDTPIVDGWRENEKKWSLISRANALGRIGSPDEVANVVLFLASEESSFVTGSTIMVDGGGLTF